MSIGRRIGVIPLRLIRFRGLRLLAFGGRDAALDGEGGAVGAGNPEAGGIASHLDHQGVTFGRAAAVWRPITHFAGMARCLVVSLCSWTLQPRLSSTEA